MAKEVAISKRAKISKAQQNVMLTVAGASVVLGVAISLAVRFVQQITFNSKVIAAEEESIALYSDTIKTIGVCEAPNGTIYSEDELRRCNPDDVDLGKIQGSLRANIIEGLAANKALNSVPKETSSGCVDPGTGKNYTYSALKSIYDEAEGTDRFAAASQLMKSCSALRVIPDALPASKNEEALLASLNKLFLESGWQPESISPSGTSNSDEEVALLPGLNVLGVNLSIKADAGITKATLDNIERSIREFDIRSATIEWEDGNVLSFEAQATAYYMDKVSFAESETIITAGGN